MSAIHIKKLPTTPQKFCIGLYLIWPKDPETMVCTLKKKFWEITVSAQKRARNALGLQKMSNGPLTFYFLWVSGCEALEDIFSIMLFQVVFSPPGRESKFVHTGLPHQLKQIKLNPRVRRMN